MERVRRTRWRYCSRCRRGNVSRCRKLGRVSVIPSVGSARHTNNASQGPDELRKKLAQRRSKHSADTYVVDLSGGRAADGIGDTNTVDTDLVNCLVQRQEVDQVGTERILAGD